MEQCNDLLEWLPNNRFPMPKGTFIESAINVNPCPATRVNYLPNFLNVSLESMSRKESLLSCKIFWSLDNWGLLWCPVVLQENIEIKIPLKLPWFSENISKVMNVNLRGFLNCFIYSRNAVRFFLIYACLYSCLTYHCFYPGQSPLSIRRVNCRLGPSTYPTTPFFGSMNPNFSATPKSSEKEVRALVWLRFSNSLSETACKMRASSFQVMVGIQFFFRVTRGRSSRIVVQAFFCSTMSCCMLLLYTAYITRCQNRLPSVTGCFELMISSNLTWYSLVWKLTRRYAPLIYFRVTYVTVNLTTFVWGSEAMTALLCPWSGTVRDINKAC